MSGEIVDATRQVEDAATRAQLAAQEEAERRQRIEYAHQLAEETSRRVAEYDAQLAEARRRLEEAETWRQSSEAERAALAETVGVLEHRLSSAEGRLAQLLNPPPPPEDDSTPPPSPSETIVSVNEETPPEGGGILPPPARGHRGVRLLHRRTT